MFEQLKGEVSKFEAKVNAAFDKVEASVGALREEVDKLDKTLMFPLERLKGIVAKVRAEVELNISKVRGEIKDLAPPS